MGKRDEERLLFYNKVFILCFVGIVLTSLSEKKTRGDRRARELLLSNVLAWVRVSESNEKEMT